MGPDYLGLLAGYVAAAGVFWVLFFAAPGFVRAHEAVEIRRPWVELGALALSVAGVIGVGQLYQRGMLLPEQGELFQSLNQVLIFAPALLALAVMRPVWAKNYLPLERAVGGLGLGVVLSLLALTAFVAVSRGIAEWPAAAGQVFRVSSISIAVQVLLEDILIAALAARLVAATNVWIAIGATAALFAAAHIPAMLAEGAGLSDLSTLVLDTGLGVMLIGAIIASRNVWWFFPVHAVMDLTQFLKP
jgi:hypothetical protein